MVQVKDVLCKLRNALKKYIFIIQTEIKYYIFNFCLFNFCLLPHSKQSLITICLYFPQAELCLWCQQSRRLHQKLFLWTFTSDQSKKYNIQFYATFLTLLYRGRLPLISALCCVFTVVGSVCGLSCRIPLPHFTPPSKYSSCLCPTAD